MTDSLHTFGKYEILGELGRGGFATVYLARDTALEREVALKLIDPYWSRDHAFSERFRQEARVAARLEHPNIVTIYEISDVDGQLYIAMELADRGSLQERLEDGTPLTPAEAIHLLAQVADALDFAHEQQLIHRDIKPANILLKQDRSGQTKALLTDFGLVKAMTYSLELTRTGTALGTPKYMAPEQIDPDRADQLGSATDIYALGIVAYQMFTGQVPFDGTSTQIGYAQVHKDPTPPSKIRSDLPDAVSDTILKALSKQPDDRFETASAFVDALRIASATESKYKMERDRPDERDEDEIAPLKQKEDDFIPTPDTVEPEIDHPLPKSDIAKRSSEIQVTDRSQPTNVYLIPPDARMRFALIYNAGSYAIAIVALMILSYFPDSVVAILTLLAAGFLIGVFQSWQLSKYVELSVWWKVGALFFMAPLVGSIIAALIQYFTLRKHVRIAWWWLVIWLIAAIAYFPYFLVQSICLLVIRKNEPTTNP